jgi:ribosome-binding factor A
MSKSPFGKGGYRGIRGGEMKERRQKQLEHLIRGEVEEIIRRHVSDPSIGFFTLTYVDISSDMKHAKIGVSVMGIPEEQTNTFNGLVKATGYIQHKLGGRLTIKYTPKIEFIYDERKEFKVEEILAELRKERDEKDSEREN